LFRDLLPLLNVGRAVLPKSDRLVSQSAVGQQPLASPHF
jgi:hypothetical protein